MRKIKGTQQLASWSSATAFRNTRKIKLLCVQCSTGQEEGECKWSKFVLCCFCRGTTRHEMGQGLFQVQFHHVPTIYLLVISGQRLLTSQWSSTNTQHPLKKKVQHHKAANSYNTGPLGALRSETKVSRVHVKRHNSFTRSQKKTEN